MDTTESLRMEGKSAKTPAAGMGRAANGRSRIGGHAPVQCEDGAAHSGILRRWLVIAALLLPILALSGCAGVQEDQATWKKNWDWVGLGGVAIAAMGFLLALAYMVSTFSHDEQMKAWTKREVGQLILSAIILSALFALSLTVDGWLRMLSAASPSPAWQDYVNNKVCCDPLRNTCTAPVAYARGRPCHIALSLDYLQILLESGRAMANGFIWNYYWPALLSQTGVSVSGPGMMDAFSLNFKLFAARSIDATFYSLLFDLTFKTMLFIRVQQIFLDFMWSAFVPMMLGVGVGLRAFHFSRKVGGMLIALGMAIYIVMPMFYVLLSAILFGFVGDWTHPTFGNTFDMGQLPIGNRPDWLDTDLTPIKQGDVLGTRMSMGDPTGGATQGQLDEQEGLVNTLWSIVKIFWNASFGAAYQVISATPMAAHDIETEQRFLPGGPLSNLAMLMVFTVVTPFLALMTVLASFKYFSPLIGGDVELSLLSRLI